MCVFSKGLNMGLNLRSDPVIKLNSTGNVQTQKKMTIIHVFITKFLSYATSGFFGPCKLLIFDTFV